MPKMVAEDISVPLTELGRIAAVADPSMRPRDSQVAMVANMIVPVAGAGWLGLCVRVRPASYGFSAHRYLWGLGTTRVRASPEAQARARHLGSAQTY